MSKTAPPTIAARAGRVAGYCVCGIRWAHEQIDWPEVGRIVLQGLRVLIVLTLLAGRGTRRGWDALVAFSERLGRAYARLIVRPRPLPQAPARPTAAKPDQRLQLETLSHRQLMAMAGCRRKVAKRELVAMLVAA